MIPALERFRGVLADKAQQWEGALGLLQEVVRQLLTPDVVSFSAAAVTGAGPLAAAARSKGIGVQTAGPYPDPDFRQLDSWIVIHGNNTATFYVGKTDCGQGTGTAFRQMMADELDIAYDSTSLVMGSTDVTPDQGGSGGSDAIQTDGWPMRRVAAEARRILLALAAERFGVPVDLLSVNEAVVSMTSDPSRKVTYAELIGGQRFDVNLRGRTVNEMTGVATVKPVDDIVIRARSGAHVHAGRDDLRAGTPRGKPIGPDASGGASGTTRKYDTHGTETSRRGCRGRIWRHRLRPVPESEGCRDHPRRSAQPPPLPAPALSGGHRRALARRHRHGQSRAAARQFQHARAYGRGDGDRHRNPRGAAARRR